MPTVNQAVASSNLGLGGKLSFQLTQAAQIEAASAILFKTPTGFVWGVADAAGSPPPDFDLRPGGIVVVGNNLTYGVDGLPNGGTVTSIRVALDGTVTENGGGFDIASTPLFDIVGLSIDGATFRDSFIFAFESGNSAPIESFFFVLPWTYNGSGESDFFHGYSKADTIFGGDSRDELFGGSGGNKLFGQGGDDFLRAGGAGADYVSGGTGRDQVDYSDGPGVTASLADPATNTGNAEGDTYNSIENMRGSVQDDTLEGNNGANLLDGNLGSDTIRGLAGGDDLRGRSGADTLDGGADADILDGGEGDDRYIVDDARDEIVETAGNGVADRVLARASFALAADDDIEILTTSSGVGTAAIGLTGNALAQEIVGNYGVNVLNSGGIGGADLLRGLSGNDTYRIHNVADAIQEGNGQGTADKVLSSVSYTLGAGVQVEFLQTSSGAGTTSINLAGNELAQEIVGNAGANRLEGKGGADTLRGLSGADTFVFATKLGGGNIDTITDFNPAADRFLLSDAIFTALTPGTISAAQFRANTSGLAQDSSDRIIYDTNGGGVFYDADGLGGAAGTQFATVGLGLAITNADFSVA